MVVRAGNHRTVFVSSCSASQPGKRPAVHNPKLCLHNTNIGALDGFHAAGIGRGWFLTGACGLLLNPFSAWAATQADLKSGLAEELVELLRVRQAVSMEEGIVVTGKAPQEARQNVERSVAMMIDNFDLPGRFVRASAFLPPDQQEAAQFYSESTIQSLDDIVDDFKGSGLLANQLNDEQKKSILAHFKTAIASIDGFLTLMPTPQVDEARRAVRADDIAFAKKK
eukprot:6187812-Pleurochrysis_carterae.AAC.2